MKNRLLLIFGFLLLGIIFFLVNYSFSDKQADFDSENSAKAAFVADMKTDRVLLHAEGSKSTQSVSQEKLLSLEKLGFKLVDVLGIKSDSFTFDDDVKELLGLSDEEFKEMNLLSKDALARIKAIESERVETVEASEVSLIVKIDSDDKMVQSIIGELRSEIKDLIGERRADLLDPSLEKLSVESGYDKILSYTIDDLEPDELNEWNGEFQFIVESIDENGDVKRRSKWKRRTNPKNPAFVNERYDHVITLDF